MYSVEHQASWGNVWTLRSGPTFNKRIKADRSPGPDQEEYVSRARRAKFSHALVWPLELGIRTPTLQCGHLSGPSRTRRGFFDFEVGGHDGAYKGRVRVTVPFVGRKNGNSHANSHTMCLCLGFLGYRRE